MGRTTSRTRHARRVRRTALAVGLTLPFAALSTGLGAAAALADDGPSRPVEVYSTADADAVRSGQYTSAMAWRLWRGDPSVLAANEAIASARCTKCRAVAVAVQILVVSHVTLPTDASQPLTGEVNVSNLSLALNLSGPENGSPATDQGAPTGQGEPVVTRRTATVCSGCSTVALAYQFVIVSPHRLALRAAARDQLELLHRQMRAVAASRLSNEAVAARENALARQVAAVLRWGVVRVPEPVRAPGPVPAPAHPVSGSRP